MKLFNLQPPINILDYGENEYLGTHNLHRLGTLQTHNSLIHAILQAHVDKSPYANTYLTINHKELISDINQVLYKNYDNKLEHMLNIFQINIVIIDVIKTYFHDKIIMNKFIINENYKTITLLKYENHYEILAKLNNNTLITYNLLDDIKFIN